MSYKSREYADRSPKEAPLSFYNERKLSTSSSDYSYDSDPRDPPSETSTRRATTPSKGGADRRRVAIMQMPSIRSRRGHKSDLTGLALVAPPDAAPTAYTHLSPPPFTAECTPQTATTEKYSSSDSIPNLDQESKENQISSPSPHSRSQSPSHLQSPTDHVKGSTSLRNSHHPLTHSPMFSPVTPEIGQGKDIHAPVVGPIVFNLGSRSTKAPSSPSSRTNSPFPDSSFLASPTSSTASFLHYQPGAHSVAGPLPPPPRANFNIDIHNPPPPRPPRLQTRTKRDLDAVKQNLQLPPSVTAALSSKSSNLSIAKSYKENLPSDLSDIDSKPLSYVHKREGALSALDDIIPADPASVIVPGPTATEPPESLNIENKGTTTADEADIPSVTIVQPPSHSTTSPAPAEIDHHKFTQWLKSNPELAQPLETKRARRGSSVDETHYKQRPSSSPPRSMTPDSVGGSDAPSPPPKSFRNSLTTNLKRLSLSRTASLSSKAARRWSAGSSAHYSSRTPSPSLRRASPPPQFQKIRSTNPAALFCHEVNSQRTTTERCMIYATKINELYLYDCGLSEWVVNMKSRGPNTYQRAPSAQPFAPQPRHTSRSSMLSEATFPRRPDASTATDLSQGTYEDITPTSVSLTLPYPSLAMNPPSRSNTSVGASPSIRSLTPSTATSKSGGFFASLGRRTSISKKDRPNNLPTSPSSGSLSSVSSSGRLLSISSKRTTTSSMNISRPINITSPPTVPGGPRAPPNRNQRSHTFTPSFPPTSNIVSNDIGRRPSMFDLSLEPVIDIHAEPEFYQQVDKLANLLPHADRDVLAGYLRRAGQDMRAIGQYLEDEKNGTIQTFD